MDVVWLKGLEPAMFGARCFSLHVTQVLNLMATQAGIQARARYMRVQQLSNNSQQIIQRDQQRLVRFVDFRLSAQGSLALERPGKLLGAQDHVHHQ